MSVIYHTKGIVLNKLDYSENSNLYTVYTYDLGKITCICRGSKKINSKLSGHLENFAVTNLVLVQGRNMFGIIGASYSKIYKKILSDYRKIFSACYCLELTDKLIKESEKDIIIFNLLEDILFLINEDHNNKYFEEILIYSFGLKILSLLGFTPQLYECVRCRNNIRNTGNIFSNYEGGLICKNCCSKNYYKGIQADENVIKILRIIISSDICELKQILLNKELSCKISKLLKEIIYYNLEGNLKTRVYNN